MTWLDDLSFGESVGVLMVAALALGAIGAYDKHYPDFKPFARVMLVIGGFSVFLAWVFT